MTSSTQFWTKDPSVLFNSEHIGKLLPQSNMTTEEKLNAITRLVIILTILGYLISQTIRIVVTGLITLGVIIILYNMKDNNQQKQKIKTLSTGENEGKKENFSNMKVYDAIKSQNLYTTPTSNNPMMNVLLTDIADNPMRKAAAPAYQEAIETDINEKTKKFISSEFNDPTIDEKLFRDLGDAFEFDRSMINFHATPNTRIPNDQGSFAEFLYGGMISCKENNGLACTRDNPRYNLY